MRSSIQSPISTSPIDTQDIDTYSTNHLVAPPTLPNQVPSTAPGLAVVIASVLHIEPVTGPSSITKALARFDSHGLIATVQRRSEEALAVLEQAKVNLTACSGEAVESIQVDLGRYRNDDAGKIRLARAVMGSSVLGEGGCTYG